MYSQKDFRPPYDFDVYSAPFLPVGERLELLAAEAKAARKIGKMSDLLLYSLAERRPFPSLPQVPLPGCGVHEADCAAALLPAG